MIESLITLAAYPSFGSGGRGTGDSETARQVSRNYFTGIIVVMTVAIRMYHGMPSVTL